MPNGRQVNRSLSIVIAAIVLTSCRDATIASPVGRYSPPTLSGVAVPTAAQHVFVLQGRVPADFTSRVVARGGFVVSSMTEIGVVVTGGLSDEDANVIAGKDAVARDFIGRWVPTPDEMRLQATALAVPSELAGTRSPLSAAFLPLQWNMFEIHAPEAWAMYSGLPTVRVAILDSGLDPDHVDQRGRIDEANSVAFVPSTTGPPAWADDNLHGTFVGGIVTSNNVGTAGVAPDVTLIAVKVLGADGRGPIGAVIAGVYYATDVGAQVINMSLGLAVPKNVPGVSTLLSALNRAVNYAHTHGVLVVSAAGNDAADLQHDHDFVELPCEAGVQLCVSATRDGDRFAAYSNYGTGAIDVAAPGGEGAADLTTWIYGLCSGRAADPTFAVCKDELHYMVAGGTSASAPHVSGLAAYLESQFGGRLKPSELISIITQHSDDIGKPGLDPYFGKGRINVANTMTASNP